MTDGTIMFVFGFEPDHADSITLLSKWNLLSAFLQLFFFLLALSLLSRHMPAQEERCASSGSRDINTSMTVTRQRAAFYCAIFL
jgi:hypothetical protein